MFIPKSHNHPLSQWPILTMTIMSPFTTTEVRQKHCRGTKLCTQLTTLRKRWVARFCRESKATKWWEKWGLQTRFHGKNPFQKPGILSMVVWFSMKLAMCKTCHWISMKLSMKLAIWKTCGWISRGRKSRNVPLCFSNDWWALCCVSELQSYAKVYMPSCCTIGKLAVRRRVGLVDEEINKAV